MHVVLVNQAFYPDVVATAQMAKDLADALVSRGHRVSVVASRSIYGQSGAALARRETVDGIEVHRVGSSLFGKASILARVADFGLFYLRATWRVLRLERPDVVVGFTTPPFIAACGVLARWLRGSKAVYWVMDLYPDLPVACGVMRAGSPVTRVCEAVNRAVLRRSDAAVVLGRCMMRRVVDKGVPGERVRHITVWPVDAGLRQVAHGQNPYRRRWGLEGKTCVMYSGNFGLGHETGTICAAMARLAGRDDLAFRFVGGGKRRAEVERAIETGTLGDVSYHDYVPIGDLAASLSAGDVHLISLREGVEGIMVPSKLFGVMAVSRPAVFIGHPDSEIARILTEAGAGVVVREGDDAGLAREIERLAADGARRDRMGDAGARALPGRLDAAAACRAWCELLESLAGGRAPDAVRAEEAQP